MNATASAAVAVPAVIQRIQLRNVATGQEQAHILVCIFMKIYIYYIPISAATLSFLAHFLAKLINVCMYVCFVRSSLKLQVTRLERPAHIFTHTQHIHKRAHFLLLGLQVFGLYLHCISLPPPLLVGILIILLTCWFCCSFRVVLLAVVAVKYM